MKILVTGGTGFIGSYMANHLHDNGHDVTICDNTSISQTTAAKKARLSPGLRQ